MTSNVPIILASGSPRRRELLTNLGLQFEVIPADIDETQHIAELPSDLVSRLSISKAKTIAEQYPEALVIAADTTVALGKDILEKPKDRPENKTFIERLQGRSHDVFTGHALLYKGRLESLVQHSEVYVRPLTEEEINAYVETGEGLDKAGGYGIQGRGAALIPHIVGCYFNVMGMSVAAVVELAAKLGVRLL
ncbi:MAG: Maf family protein [Trueperaceae bacterium]